jgi:hypothetical protein
MRGVVRASTEKGRIAALSTQSPQGNGATGER